jgi:hypothetical protein
MNAKSVTFLVCFGLFWSSIVLVFDGLIIIPGVRQIIATHYPSTDGTILSSEVTRHRGSKGGTTYGVEVSYKYSVNGIEYTGNRYRYYKFSSSDSAWAYNVVNRLLRGAQTRVYYDPRNPENAVLATGLEGSDLFMLMFLTPFNGVMLALLVAPFSALRRKWLKPVAGGVKVISELRKTRARMNAYSPFTLMVITTALLAFLGMFIVAFLFGGFHPSMRTALAAWSCILCGGMAVGGWYWMRVLSGKYDLVIDELGGVLELPLTQGRKERRRVPFSNVEGMFVETKINPSRGRNGPTMVYLPTLNLNGTAPTTEVLVEWSDEDKAKGFIEWLRGKLPSKPSPIRPLAGKF